MNTHGKTRKKKKQIVHKYTHAKKEDINGDTYRYTHYILP